ncbi:MAG: hypothetical protein KKA79_10230 [Nanoarchaeota archaeon]|nr:hypothetical protein [Nanoarchaeota archaeon]
MKNTIILISILIIVGNVFAITVVPKNNIDDPNNFYDMDCEFPIIERINHSLDIYYGSPVHTQDLVKGSYNNKVVFTLTTRGNLSGLKDYGVRPFVTITCGEEIIYNLGQYFDPRTTQLPDGTYVTEFRFEDNFKVPEDAKICRASARAFGTNSTSEYQTNCHNRNSSCRCLIRGISRVFTSPSREPLTFNEYINKQQAAISESQVEFSKRQTNISKKLVELEEKRSLGCYFGSCVLEGVDKGYVLGVLGTLFGAAIALIGSFLGGYVLQERRDKKERIKRAVDTVCSPIRGILLNHINSLKNLQFRDPNLKGMLGQYEKIKLKDEFLSLHEMDKGLEKEMNGYFGDKQLDEYVTKYHKLFIHIRNKIKEIYIEKHGKKDFEKSSLSGSIHSHAFNIENALLENKTIDEEFIKTAFDGYDEKTIKSIHELKNKLSDLSSSVKEIQGIRKELLKKAKKLNRKIDTIIKKH